MRDEATARTSATNSTPAAFSQSMTWACVDPS